MVLQEKCKKCGHEKKYHYNKGVPTGKIFMCCKWENGKYCGCAEGRK